MPELPEVETVKRGLSAKLTGAVVQAVWHGKKPLRQPLPPTLQSKLAGRALTAIDRRAKYLLLRFSGDKTLLLHLGMSGRLTISEGPLPRQTHDHLVIDFADGQRLTFNDARRFGVVDFFTSGDEAAHPLLAHLGPEPLDHSFTPACLGQQLKNRKTALKVALMDQQVVVGVGNIYASEALFRAKISPLRPAGSLSAHELKSLTAAIKAVLKAAIAAGGSSLRDYVQSDGELGYFQHRFKVYGREGQPCPDCGSKIERLTQGGRSTFWCPKTQI